MKIRFCTLMAICLLLPFNCFSQDVQQSSSNQTNTDNKIRELGLVFSNLNSFGIRYKCGTDKILFRITALSISGSNLQNNYTNYNYKNIDPYIPSNVSSSDLPKNSNSTVGASLNFGFEKRKQINDKFYFYYGLDWINSYSNVSST